MIWGFFKLCCHFCQLSENFAKIYVFSYYNPPFIINNKNSCFMETGKDRHSRVCPFIETAERWNYLNYRSLTPHPNRRSKNPLVSYFQKKRHLHLYLTVIFSSRERLVLPANYRLRWGSANCQSSCQLSVKCVCFS